MKSKLFMPTMATQSREAGEVRSSSVNLSYLTVEEFSNRHSAFSQPALRNLIFKASPQTTTAGDMPGNGLIEAGAIVRIGRKVLINEPRFFDWVRVLNGGK